METDGGWDSRDGGGHHELSDDDRSLNCDDLSFLSRDDSLSLVIQKACTKKSKLVGYRLIEITPFNVK